MLKRIHIEMRFYVAKTYYPLWQKELMENNQEKDIVGYLGMLNTENIVSLTLEGVQNVL